MQQKYCYCNYFISPKLNTRQLYFELLGQTYQSPLSLQSAVYGLVYT